jgi:hypothetical protein
VPNTTDSFLLTTASYTKKVVYDHTHIASYQRWGARSVGSLPIWLLALDGRDAELAGGLSSDPILYGLRRTGEEYRKPSFSLRFLFGSIPLFRANTGAKTLLVTQKKERLRERKGR